MDDHASRRRGLNEVTEPDDLYPARAIEPELIEAGSGSYLALELGGGFGGGIVECGTARPLWLPYVEVGQVEESTEHARQLGASVLLAPREGPTGWRSVVSSPQGGELALWQPKR